MKGKYEELKNDVRHELQSLEKLITEMKGISCSEDISTRRVIGSILHDS